MTKLSKTLLIVLGILVIFGVILYIYLQQNTVGADTTTSDTKSIYATNRLQSTDPPTTNLTTNPAVTPKYNWPKTSRLLTANYTRDISTQIKLADVYLAQVSSTDGTTEAPVSGLKIQFTNSGTIANGAIIVTVPTNLVESTVYHWKIKPSGTVFTDAVDVKFLTADAASVTGPVVSSVTQATTSTISAVQDKAALCKIDLYSGTSLRQTLSAEVSYKGCSADVYIKKAYNVSPDQQTGAFGLNPSVKVQQTFKRMLDLDSRNNIYNSTVAYSVKATATNSKGTNSLSANIGYMDSVSFTSVTQISSNTYKMISDPIYGTDGKLLPVGTAINVKASDSAAGPIPAIACTTDATGRITIPVYAADPNKTEFVDFTANYKPTGSTVTFPIINSRFLLVNY